MISTLRASGKRSSRPSTCAGASTHARLIPEGSMPPILCININLTKEIRNFMRISFFANNMFRSTPIWESKVYPGKYTRRNAKTFFFGAALSVKIR